MQDKGENVDEALVKGHIKITRYIISGCWVFTCAVFAAYVFIFDLADTTQGFIWGLCAVLVLSLILSKIAFGLSKVITTRLLEKRYTFNMETSKWVKPDDFERTAESDDDEEIEDELEDE